jgi:hypothetical protein
MEVMWRPIRVGVDSFDEEGQMALGAVREVVDF